MSKTKTKQNHKKKPKKQQTQTITKKINQSKKQKASFIKRVGDEYILASFCNADTKEWMHTWKKRSPFHVEKKAIWKIFFLQYFK